MVTFLVLNIIMTIVTAAASIVITFFLSFWNTVNRTDCMTVGDSCVCNIGYDTYTYDGRILLLVILVSYVSTRPTSIF